MRLLLVNQFYPPDLAPTGQVLHDLAKSLVARGHDVTALCSRRSYEGGRDYPAREEREGVRVVRLPTFGLGRDGVGRAAEDLSFHLAVLFGARRDAAAFDLTVSLTTPPYLGWTVARALGRRAGRHAHWVMDVYPDVLVAHGGLRRGGIGHRLLQELARRQMRAASLVVTLGPRMRERVAPYVTRSQTLEWVPLWGTTDAAASPAEIAALRKGRGWKPEDCVLLYSGNMGLGHRFEDFLAAASTLGAAGPVWAFAGGGRRRGEIARFAAANPGSRVTLLPYRPPSERAVGLAAGDVHLLCLRQAWSGLSVPSKLQAAFALSRPVIVVGPRDSEAAEWTLASGGGWVVDEGDVTGLLRAVSEASDPEERARRGEAARRFAAQHFDRDRNTGRIGDLLEACVR